MAITLTNAQINTLLNLAAAARSVLHEQRADLINLGHKPGQSAIVKDNDEATDALSLIIGKLNVAAFGTPNPKQYS
jgi:hypothetical protein